MPDSLSVSDSYLACRRIARAAARNFYYGFRLLPAAKRDALSALYAFMRQVDDVADEPGESSEKAKRLASRRAEMDRALAGTPDANPVWPAFCHTVHSFHIPPRYLHDLISGAEMDLTVSTYETFERLREYCYRVAGTVGLCCVHVFGFDDPRALEFAERLGIAFQMTNILRDLPRDLLLGRVYLPLEDLARFGCNKGQLGGRQSTAALRLLVEFELDRAAAFYREGWQLIELVHPDSRAALWTLARIYAGILDKIKARDFDVFSPPPPRLTAVEKVWILAQAHLGRRTPPAVLAPCLRKAS